MPEPDLIAYLDGEADAATAQRFAARLRTDPDLRAQLLTLMRQRVALTRVLTQAAPIAVPARHPRRWWAIAVAGLAAASIALVIVLSWPSKRSPTEAPLVQPLPDPAQPPGTDEKNVTPSPTPTVQPELAPLRLADGTVLTPGQVIEASHDQPLEQRLADGTVFSLAPDSALVVPMNGKPWTLRRGTVVCAMAEKTRIVSEGIATDEALVTGSGRIQMSLSPDGTRVRLLAGHAVARDTVTIEHQPLRVGAEWWVPADTAAPREGEDGALGVARGTVVEVGEKGRSVVLRTRFGTFSFRPEWLVKPPGLDAAMSARLAKLQPGDQVAITWRMSEHLRVESVRLIAPARVLPEDGMKPSANDF